MSIVRFGVVLSFGCAVFLANADVIYRETFGIAPDITADQSPLIFGWARFDDLGQEIIGTESSSGVNYSVNGRPVDVSNVNAGGNSDGTFGPYARGILYMEATPSPSLALTTEYTVNVADYVPGSIVFSWYEGNNTTPHFFRLVVRVGGIWYASVETFTTPATPLANFGTEAQFKTLTYDPTAAKWLRVRFDGDVIVTDGQASPTESTLGAVTLAEKAANDLSGPITGFGVYSENGGTGVGNRRIDSFTIQAAPLATTFRISIVSLTAQEVTLRAAGGEPDQSFNIRVSNNLSNGVGVANWTVLGTKALDTNGVCTVILPRDTTATRQFYALEIP